MHLKHPELDDVPLSGTHVTLLVFDHLSLLIRDLCFAPLFFHDIVHVFVSRDECNIPRYLSCFHLGGK